MAVDLHIHSKASSDGEFSAQELVAMAKQQGLEAIAITDHDTVDSVEEELYWGKRYGVEVIPGCELSADQQGKYLHILGYYIDHRNRQLLDFLAGVYQERFAGIDRQLEILRDAGFYINKSDVMAACHNTMPLPSIYARLLFDDSRNNGHPLLEMFRNQENYVLKFCVEYFIPGRELYAPEYIPEAHRVIETIIKAEGVPVLAHPGATLTRNDNQVIDALLEMGLAGLEVNSNWHDEEQEEFYADFCRERNLLRTCGSDFHGQTKPNIRLGSVKNNSYEVVRKLRETRLKMFGEGRFTV